MMTDIINLLGGYDSWGFALTSIGFTLIGGGLLAWKIYFLPLPTFGCLLLLSYIVNETARAAERLGLSPIAEGFIKCVPVLCAYIWFLSLIHLATRSLNRKYNRKSAGKGND